MPHLTTEDFSDIDSDEKLNDILSTGFGLAGDPGTEEHVRDAIDALSTASDDIYWDYAEYVADNGFPATAASHANISRLQVSAGYARRVLTVLADNPDLFRQVHAAMAAPARPVTQGA